MTVATDQGDLVLDSRTDQIKPWSATPHTYCTRQASGDPRSFETVVSINPSAVGVAAADLHGKARAAAVAAAAGKGTSGLHGNGNGNNAGGNGNGNSGGSNAGGNGNSGKSNAGGNSGNNGNRP